MRHTPGPWLLVQGSKTIRGAVKKVFYEFRAAISTKDQLMAGAKSIDHGKELKIRATGRSALGDARLAVCAPELLKVLEAVVDHNDGYLSRDLEPDWLKDCRTVIKKAKGRKS